MRNEISTRVWPGRSLTHSYRPEAYTTSLELESQLSDEQIADLLDSGEDYTGVRAYYRDASGQQKYETAGGVGMCCGSSACIAGRRRHEGRWRGSGGGSRTCKGKIKSRTSPGPQSTRKPAFSQKVL